MNLASFAKALQKSWSREISCSPDSWSADNLALGQCVVLALRRKGAKYIFHT